MDIEQEIQKSRDALDESRAALLASGITDVQMEQFGKFVLASITLIQYGTMKAAQDVQLESALEPGSFQTRVL